MKTTNTSSLVTPLSILGALFISACSSGGSVTTLDASPAVSIGLPQVLLNSGALDSNNLSPTILLSTGESVSMQKGEGNAWSGTINVTPGTAFSATVTWRETLDGRELPLAQLEQTLEVTADGMVNTTSSTDYDTNIDTDNDGTSNLQERENGTDPFTAPAPIENENSADDANSEQSSTPANDDTDTASATSDSQELTTSSAQTSSTDTSETDSSTTSSQDTSDASDSTNPDTDSSTVADTSTTSESSSSDSDDATTDSDSESTDSSQTSDADEDEVTDSESTSEPVVVDTVVPRIATSAAPTIDGLGVTMDTNYNLTGEWAAAIQTDGSGAPLVIENLMIDIDAEETSLAPYRRWAAMHDGTYLYIVVVVDDNGDRNRDSLSELTEDDSLEMFFDGDNSKSTQYGSDDFHHIFPVQLAGVDKRSATSGDVAGSNSAEGLNVLFATGPGIGPRGIRRARYEQDVYELRIRLSSAGIDTDEAFGFELQINDDDGGDARDSKWGWKHPARQDSDVDGTSSNPSLMGTLKLD